MHRKIVGMPPLEPPSRLCNGHLHERHRASHFKLRSSRHPLGTMRLCRRWKQDTFWSVIFLASLASMHVQGSIGESLERSLSAAVHAYRPRR